MLESKSAISRKAVLVTGTSSGIGASTTIRLASRGFHVFAGVRHARDVGLWAKVSGVEPIVLELRSEESIRAAIGGIYQRLGEFDEVHLVNNAGIVVAGPVECLGLDCWRDQFEVNVFGLVAVTQALLPMIRAKRGRIVNVSSIAGLVASPFLGAYSASKFALEAISDALRRELLSIGCKVIVLEPGPTATPIWQKNLGTKDALLSSLSADHRAAYSHGLKWFDRESRRTVELAIPADRVSAVIERALVARRPRARYVVGRRGLALQMLAASILPDRWLDKIISSGID